MGLKSRAPLGEANTLVVGAGIAGLYTAWRLLKGGARNVTVLEALDRIGGRLATSIVPVGGKTIQVEEGGMRFLDRHHHLSWLLRELSLSDTVVDFGMGDDNNLFYLRGRRFTRRDATEGDDQIWSEIYTLGESEKGKSPTQILDEVKKEILTAYVDPKKWNPQTPEEWRHLRLEARFRGQPIYRWGLRALLAEFGLSTECVRMLIDTGGFACPYDDMINAGAALQLLGNFPTEPEFRTLRSGYQILPEKLRRTVEDLGGRVVTGLKVTRIDPDDDGYKIQTADTYRDTYRCSTVVLALPASPLKEIASVSPPLMDRLGLQDDLNAVVHMPLTKINLYFERQWWRDRFKVKHGGCFTDLPLAQVYFFEFEDVDRDEPAAITIYCDSVRSTFWRQLQVASEPYKDMEIPGVLEPCSKLVVKHALEQLKQLFGADELPEPILASYRAWGSSRTGEGDHQWAIGVNDREISDRIWNPASNLFICGESFSDDQAWVEGALRSAERVLQAGFELDKLPL